MPARGRRRFGANKYAAFHLLLARWIRHSARNADYDYITLGGTELRDIVSLAFVDRRLVTSATSYEQDSARHGLALATAGTLPRHINIRLIQGSIFDAERRAVGPHIFFVDLEKACEGADMPERFASLLQREVIREGDVLFITSYLGRNVGYDTIFDRYDGEFRVLGVEGQEEKRKTYRRAHPGFTLYRALERADLTRELKLRCFGATSYFDTSAMGLYGYTVEQGSTTLPSLVDAPFFNVSNPAET